MKLKFSKSNSKLAKLSKVTGKRVYSFSLLSGYTCPGALDCQSFAQETKDGLRIKDGKNTKFRCFSASQEVLWSNVYKSRKYNLDSIRNCKSTDEIAKLINSSLPNLAEIVRVHVAGDFFSENYFLAWIQVAKKNPNRLFYAYTKSLRILIKHKKKIPKNFSITASKGGRYDNLIKKYKLKFAEVVFSKKEAKEKGLEIDETDELALLSPTSFALLLHGQQPKNSAARKALSKNERQSKNKTGRNS